MKCSYSILYNIVPLGNSRDLAWLHLKVDKHDDVCGYKHERSSFESKADLFERAAHILILKKRGHWGQYGGIGQMDTCKMNGYCRKQKPNPGKFLLIWKSCPGCIFKLPKRGYVLEKRGCMVTLTQFKRLKHCSIAFFSWRLNES